MSSWEKLKSVLISFSTKKEIDRNAVIEEIRNGLAGMLSKGENFSVLLEHLPNSRYTYRAEMWSILLALGNLDKSIIDQNIESYILIDKKVRKNLVGEVRRIRESQKEQKIQTDFESCCSFLVLLSGFLNKIESDNPLYQPLLTFGPLFLQYFSFPISFFAFSQFVKFYAPKCYPHKKNGGRLLENPAKLAVQIAYEYSPPLKESYKNKMPEVSVSYAHLVSFFTQIKQLDQVSILFDFIFAFGTYFVIFFEAAWLVENPIQPEDPRTLPDATKIIRRALDILKKVAQSNPKVIDEAKAYYE